MASSIIGTNKGTYFIVIYVTVFINMFFIAIKALYELKLLVDINCCNLKKNLEHSI